MTTFGPKNTHLLWIRPHGEARITDFYSTDFELFIIDVAGMTALASIIHARKLPWPITRLIVDIVNYCWAFLAIISQFGTGAFKRHFEIATETVASAIKMAWTWVPFLHTSRVSCTICGGIAALVCFGHTFFGGRVKYLSCRLRAGTKSVAVTDRTFNARLSVTANIANFGNYYWKDFMEQVYFVGNHGCKKLEKQQDRKLCKCHGWCVKGKGGRLGVFMEAELRGQLTRKITPVGEVMNFSQFRPILQIFANVWLWLCYLHAVLGWDGVLQWILAATLRARLHSNQFYY